MGILAMPGPGSNKAPLFEFYGKTFELHEFFELFEDLASCCALTDEQMCKTIVRYTDVLTKRFWVTLTGYESRDYAAFKKSILATYPRARYTIRDLETIVIDAADSDISTETELLQYYRQFRPVAVWLEANAKISARERDQYFWQGLPHSARRAIGRRLERKEADFEKVLEAGRFVLSEDAFDAVLNEPINGHLRSMHDTRGSKLKPSRTSWDSDEEEERKDARREVQTKRAVFTPPPAPLKSTLDKVEALAREMHGLDISHVNYAVCYTQLVYLVPIAANVWAAPRTH